MSVPNNEFFKTVALWVLTIAMTLMGLLYNNMQSNIRDLETQVDKMRDASVGQMDIKDLRSQVDKIKDERVTQSDLLSFKEEVRSEMRAMGANIDNKLNTLLYVVSGGNPPKSK